MSLGIISFLKSLVPHIEKEKILEDLRITEQELQTTVLPAYNDAAAFFSSDKFKSKDNESIDDDIRALLKPGAGGKGATFINDFAKRLVLIEQNIGVLVKVINHEVGRDIVTDGVSSKKIALVRIAGNMSYISRYSLDLLMLVYMNEALALGNDSSQIKMSKAEVAKALGAVGNLARMLSSYAIDSKEFERILAETPDLLLNKVGDNQDIEASYSDKDLDPLTNPGLAGFTGSPIYGVRLVIANWQAQRYKAAQEKKKVLEMRLLHLGLLRDKQGTNPQVEQQIAYDQARVAKIDKYLQEVEDDLGIAA